MFPLLLAGLLAGLTYWLELATRPPLSHADGRTRHDPDYIVEDFEVRRYGPDGNLQHTLRAARMIHYPDDDSTFVLSPDLTYHSHPPTSVRANEARIDGKGEHIQLGEDVRVMRAAARGKDATVLTTTRLDVFPDDEIAMSDQPVSIIQGESIVQGSGLKANNKTSLYVLEGPVRGTFHRHTAKGKPSPTVPQSEPIAQAPVRPLETVQPNRAGAKRNAKAKSRKTKSRAP